ncbi:MAG: hypothetical protein Q9219_001873 [cf. Caloplaca sp. 3 TL-2023]
MKHLVALLQALITLLCFSLAALIPPPEPLSSIDNGSPSTFLNASLISADESRFSMRATYGEETLPATPVFLNAIELVSRYVELDNLSRTRQRHGIVLPEYPQVEIAVIPKPPARSLEVRLVIWALYGAVLDMVFKNRFRDTEIEMLWDHVAVGHIYFTRSAALLGTTNQTSLFENTPDTTEPSDTTPNAFDVEAGRFDWRPVYAPTGKIIPPNHVLLLLLGALKAMAPSAMTEKVPGPFHVGSELVDANLQVYLHNRRLPRTSPPFFEYGHVLLAIRRIPAWMLSRHKFAEFYCTIEVLNRPIGALLIEKGAFVPPTVADSGNISTS